MVDLEREQNLQRVKDVALKQQAQIKHLTRILTRQDALLTKLSGRPSNLALELAAIEALSDATVLSTPSQPSPPREPASVPAKPVQSGHGPTEQRELAHVVITSALDDADKTCPSCGGTLVEMTDQFESSELVDVVEVQYRVVESRRRKYRCNCGSCVDTALPAAAVPAPMVPGGRYSVAFATKVAIDKYAHHLPLERQTRIMKQHGLSVSSQTLWDQVHALATQLEPTWKALREQLMREPVIGIDTTGWPNLDDKNAKKWQMWCVAGARDVFHTIRDDKSAATFADLIGDYRGVVVADQAGTNVAGAREGPGIKLVACWAHVFRKFDEIQADHPEAVRMLEWIGELYAIDRDADTEDARAELRRTKSASVLSDIKTWLDATVAPMATALGKAIRYTANAWPALRAFVDDAKIWLDNNPTERGLRGPVVGRRNHFGSKSERGTKVASILYSLIESAKGHGADPAKYLAAAIDAARAKQVLLPASFVGTA